MRYLVCTVNRSGSTWLCDLMHNTGLMGDPREYFNSSIGDGEPTFRRTVGVSPDAPDAEYWLALQRLGACGAKVGRSQFPRGMAVVRPKKLIYVVRKDLDGMAISQYRASITGMWYDGRPTPPVDVLAIERFRKVMAASQAAWPKLLYESGLHVLTVQYEKLIENPLREMVRVATHLSVQLDEDYEPYSVRQVQRDDWTERARKLLCLARTH